MQDIVDSDFDDPEDEDDDGDDGGAAEKAARAKPKRRAQTGKYVDPALKKPSARAAQSGEARPAKRVRIEEPQDNVERTVDRSSLRKSTKAASEQADRLRQEREAVLNEKRMQKREREKAKEPEKPMTQEEMLAEADVTAVKNKADLEILLKLEERKRLPKQEATKKGPTMTVLSRKDGTFVGFSDKDADVRSAMFPQACERGDSDSNARDPSAANADPPAAKAQLPVAKAGASD